MAISSVSSLPARAPDGEPNGDDGAGASVFNGLIVLHART
jgi:hypothetical protein